MPLKAQTFQRILVRGVIKMRIGCGLCGSRPEGFN